MALPLKLQYNQEKVFFFFFFKGGVAAAQKISFTEQAVHSVADRNCTIFHKATLLLII